MHTLLTTLTPFFLIIALGAGLQRGGFFPAGVIGVLNRLNFWVGLPAVILGTLATAEHGESRPVALLLGLAATTLLLVGLGLLAARLLRLPGEATGTFVQAVFRGNWAFVGLPVLLTLPGVSRTVAVLVMAPMMILFNGLAVTLLVASRHGLGRGVVRTLALEILRNPIILSSAAGGLIYASGWSCPGIVTHTLGQIGAMVVPLALICIGASLVSLPLRGNRLNTVAASAAKSFLAPLLGWAVGMAFGLGGGEMLVMLVYMASPTAMMSYAMVRQLGGDEALAAGTVVLSTLFSAVSITAVVALAAG